MEKSSLGVLIKGGRDRIGLTVREAAAFLRVSAGYLSGIENGSRSTLNESLIVSMSILYDIAEDDLFVAAGVIPPDVKEKILNQPEIMGVIRGY